MQATATHTESNLDRVVPMNMSVQPVYLIRRAGLGAHSRADSCKNDNSISD
jgi:hypothetical protein